MNKSLRLLVYVFVINTGLTIVELWAGYVSSSIALKADGFQNLTDSIVIFIAYLAVRFMSKCRANKAKQVVVERSTGCINALILIALAIYIFIASINKLEHPHIVDNELVIAAGLFSVAINWCAAFMLRNRRKQKSLQAPYVALLFSGISGMGVFVSGIISKYLNLVDIDALTGLIIGLILLVRSIKLFRQSFYHYSS